MLSLLRAEREYVQLHRDTTVSSLTLRLARVSRLDVVPVQPYYSPIVNEPR